MGVLNLSLSIGPYTQEGRTDGILIHENMDASYGPRDIRLVWSTEQGTDWQKEWVFFIEAWGYSTEYFYMSERSSIGSFGATIPASQCNPVRPDGDGGRVWWSHNLDIGGLIQRINGGSTRWLYSSRDYDSIDLRVSVRSNFNDGVEWNGATGSDTATLSASIGFCPVYTITGAEYDADDTLEISYETTWKRIDDRYWLQRERTDEGEYCQVQVTSVPGGGNPALLNGDATGTVAARGVIRVPGYLLTQHVVGQRIYLNIAFNSVYRPVGMFFAAATATLYVEDGSVCNTPVLRVKQEGETIVIGTADSGDLGRPIGSVIVRMASANSSYDTVTVPCGEDAVFPYAPFGRTLYFTGVGTNDSGEISAPSNTVSAESSPGPAGAVVLDSDAIGERVTVTRWERGQDRWPSVKKSPEVEVVKLAGRAYPSAYYGTGGTSSIDFSCALDSEQASQLDMMAVAGDMVCRFPDGGRYVIAPDITVKRSNYGWYTASISGQVVG